MFQFPSLRQRRVGGEAVDGGASDLRLRAVRADRLSLKTDPFLVHVKPRSCLLARWEALKGNQISKSRQVLAGRSRRIQNGVNAGAAKSRVDSRGWPIAPRGRVVRSEFENAGFARRRPQVESQRIVSCDQDLRLRLFNDGNCPGFQIC